MGWGWGWVSSACTWGLNCLLNLGQSRTRTRTLSRLRSRRAATQREISENTSEKGARGKMEMENSRKSMQIRWGRKNNTTGSTPEHWAVNALCSAIPFASLRAVNKNTQNTHRERERERLAICLKAKLNMLWQKGFGNGKQTRSTQVGKWTFSENQLTKGRGVRWDLGKQCVCVIDFQLWLASTAQKVKKNEKTAKSKQSKG